MLIYYMIRLTFVFLVFSLSSQAQVLLPIPQAPSTPTLPLPINTGGYFVFSWPYDSMGRQQQLSETNVPPEVRSGVIKMGSWMYGTWFLKANGEVIMYANQGGGASAPSKVALPGFFNSNLAKFYYLQGGSESLIGISSAGEMGIMLGTNANTFTQPNGAYNIVGFLPNSSTEGIFLTHHSNGTIKAWSVSANNNSVSQTNHVATQLNNVRVLDGSANCGLAITGTGQVFGWTSSTQALPIPYAASSGIVQVSSPLDGGTAESAFFALKNDGTILTWDNQGNLRSIPGSFSGKQFVQVITFGMNTFALTREGQILGWSRSWDENLVTFSLPTALGSGIKQIGKFTNRMGIPQLLALNSQGGMLSVSENAGAGWQLDPNIPAAISNRGGSLEFLLGDGATSFNFTLSSDGDLAVATYAGLPLDILARLVAEKILSTSNNYGLATKPEVGGAVTQGIQQVLSAPSDYNLFTTQQVQSERTAGQNDVLNNPNQWTLYTTNQIKAMVMGDLMLTRTNNGQFVLNYDIEQSDDLVAWSPYQNFAMPLTNLPTNKAFVRIKLKNQQ
jgi:hypothetical protein